MADLPDPQHLPQASVVKKKRLRISIVWIIPLLAAVVAIGIGVQRALSQGPLITITFKAAEGVEAGKTFIKYKDVRIGQVTAVELSPDYSKVVVKARIAKHAAGLMVEDAQFWVVEPRISISGVSGLNTLLSGNYIGFDAGKSLEEQRSFVGLDDPPVITNQRGRTFVLKANTLGSLGIGSPVLYRRINVGQVAAYTLADDGKSVEITVFVNAPYDKYVMTESRFWNASGIDVSIGADGVDVHTESLAALLAGGLAFATPPFAMHAERAPDDHVFTLYNNRAVAMRQPDPIERRYVLFFDQSVRGLSVGAPVTLLGLRVGEVADVGLHLDPTLNKFRPRVLITFFPDRLVAMLSERQKAAGGAALTVPTEEARLRALRRIVEEQGLRAQLKTGSLITGELYVDFDYYPNAPKPKLDWKRDPLELPVVPGGLATIEAKLTSILTKVDNMPLDAIGSEVKTTIGTLNQTLKDAEKMINRVDAQWVPEGTKTLEDLRRAIATADRALNSADRTIGNADSTFFGKDSPAPQDLRDTLTEITRAARSVRVLLDYLERHPETLIRGKKEGNP
jgi:paraquat-inducible protein B